MRQELFQRQFRIAIMIFQLEGVLGIIQYTGQNRTNSILNHQPPSPMIENRHEDYEDYEEYVMPSPSENENKITVF